MKRTFSLRQCSFMRCDEKCPGNNLIQDQKWSFEHLAFIDCKINQLSLCGWPQTPDMTRVWVKVCSVMHCTIVTSESFGWNFDIFLTVFFAGFHLNCQSKHLLRARCQANRLALWMVLPAWFDHSEERFPYKEVKFKTFCPPLTSCWKPEQNPWNMGAVKGRDVTVNCQIHHSLWCACLKPVTTVWLAIWKGNHEKLSKSCQNTSTELLYR